MKDKFTPPPISERERRRRHAEQTAAWRNKVRDRPEPRVVDRVALEAVVVALADRSIVPASVAEAIMRRMADASLVGLQRLGYADDPSRRALAVRLCEHGRVARGSAVKPALDDLKTLGHVRLVRIRKSPAVTS